jgi:hypothetical protein
MHPGTVLGGTHVNDAIRAALEAVSGRRGVEFQAARLKGDASARIYWRVELPPGVGPAPSVVVMDLGPLRGASEEVSKSPLASSKSTGGVPTLPFIDVLRWLERGGFRVPKLHHYDAASGVLILEDLGDTTFAVALGKTDAAGRMQLYRRALSTLARLQAWGARENKGCVAFTTCCSGSSTTSSSTESRRSAGAACRSQSARRFARSSSASRRASPPSRAASRTATTRAAT